jgi:transposase
MYVGLDVHSKQSVFVIEDENGKVVARGEVPTSREGMERLRTEHALPAGTAVGLETGTVSFFVARELSRVGLRPIVVDAHEVRLKAHRPTQKSDRRDALELCEGDSPRDLPHDRTRAAARSESAARDAVTTTPLRTASDF